jgi:hypothetical protein
MTLCGIAGEARITPARYGEKEGKNNFSWGISLLNGSSGDGCANPTTL